MMFAETPASIHLNDPQGDEMLNGGDSHLDVTSQGRITRESIDSGHPGFEVMASRLSSRLIIAE